MELQLGKLISNCDPTKASDSTDILPRFMGRVSLSVYNQRENTNNKPRNTARMYLVTVVIIGQTPGERWRSQTAWWFGLDHNQMTFALTTEAVICLFMAANRSLVIGTTAVASREHASLSCQVNIFVLKFIIQRLRQSY